MYIAAQIAVWLDALQCGFYCWTNHYLLLQCLVQAVAWGQGSALVVSLLVFPVALKLLLQADLLYLFPFYCLV